MYSEPNNTASPILLFLFEHLDIISGPLRPNPDSILTHFILLKNEGVVVVELAAALLELAAQLEPTFSWLCSSPVLSESYKFSLPEGDSNESWS